MSFGETQICPQSAVAATETIWPANPHIVAIWSFTGKLCWPLFYVFNSPMSVPPCFAILQVRRLEHQEWLVLVDCHTARKWVQDLHCPDRLQKVHSHTLYNTVFLIFWASPRSRHSEPPEWISSWSPIASKKNFSSTPASISLFSLPDFHVTYRQFHSWLAVTCVPVSLSQQMRRLPRTGRCPRPYTLALSAVPDL